VRVISLFCGAGGMDLGFIQAGHQIVWANDNWSDAVATYRYNIGRHVQLGSINDISPLPEAEIVIGGFPCQGFSVANRARNTSDERNALYLQFLRIVNEKRPQFFVAENVKGILSLGQGEVFMRICSDFASLGYRVRHAVLNSADYGVPQRRERVFILGQLLQKREVIPFPPPPTHRSLAKKSDESLSAWVSVGAALASLPEPSESCSDANHRDCSAYKLRFNGHLGHREVNPALPAPTITARGDDRGGVVVIHHPGNHRRVSPREAAIIQSFPDDYAFIGNRTSCYRQIANAVPPLLAKHVASCIPIR